jgi:hypothetical protein
MVRATSLVGWKIFAQGLNVVYQEVVYIDASESESVGYGKGGKLKSAFHFPTTPATATSMNLPMLGVLGAKALIIMARFMYGLKPVPFKLKPVPFKINALLRHV